MTVLFIPLILGGGVHKKHRLPEGQRIYAIGDIHGRVDLLDHLIEQIREDLIAKPLIGPRATLVFLGDYIDRGDNSAGVIERLLELQLSNEFTTIFLKGNHEASLLKFLEDPDNIVEWLDWGGDDTLKSYGLDSISVREPKELAASLKNMMPSSHLTFLRSLQLTHECGDYLFVHAGMKPGIPLEEQSERSLLWIREEFYRMRKKDRPEFTIVHGHAAARKIVDKGWRVCVDTGAVWTGALTAIALEGRQRWFLSTGSK